MELLKVPPETLGTKVYKGKGCACRHGDSHQLPNIPKVYRIIEIVHLSPINPIPGEPARLGRSLLCGDSP